MKNRIPSKKIHEVEMYGIYRLIIFEIRILELFFFSISIVKAGLVLFNGMSELKHTGLLFAEQI